MKRFSGLIILATLIIISFSFTGCSSSGDGTVTTSGTRQWTYMVYMGADNNLSQAGLADLNEMESVGSTNSVSVVLQAEFSNYYTPEVPTTDTVRFLVTNDNDANHVNLGAGQSAGGNLDMGDPATLTSFIQWATQNYPAEHYALVIWDHGAGWKERSPLSTSSLFRGAVQDETSGSFMSLPDLATAVRNANVHLDIVNFDACLMAMYEVAYEFRGLTDYMVFSEETEPGEGDPYDTILSDLTANPSMSASELSTTIVYRYDEFYALNPRGDTTKSAVDMSYVDQLDTKILELSSALTADAAATAAVQSAQNSTQHYAYTSNHDIYDLCNYLNTSLPDGTAKTVAGDIMTLIDTMVIANRTNPNNNTENNRGLALYIPTANETSSSDLAEYALLACNQSRASAAGTWGAYIETLITSAGGGNINYVDGGFAIDLSWEKPAGGTCDADLDLYIWEPAVDFETSGNGDWYAPYMGQTTPNGFFSMDSFDSGIYEEYYIANDQIYYGDYMFVINYWDNGPTCSQARAHLEWYDPASGQWLELTLSNVQQNYGLTLTYPSPQILDLSNYWNGQSATLTGLNAYSDFWVPDMMYAARTSGGAPLIVENGMPFGDKSTLLLFRFGKGSRLYGTGP